MKALQEYTEPGGHEFLQDIIDILPHFDKAFSNGDLSALSSLYHVLSQKLEVLAPYIKHDKLRVATSKAVAGCEQLSKSLTEGGTLEDCNKLVQSSSLQVKSLLLGN